MNKKNRLVLFFILVIFSFSEIRSQTKEEAEKKSLSYVLELIEDRYDIRFSYADDTILNKTVSVPKTDLPLKQVLLILETNTGLKFEIIDDRFIAIKKNQEFANETLASQQLDEVYIKNYLTSGISTNRTGAIIIKPDDFGILPGLIEPDILQTIQALPGILSVDETVSNINVRGGTHDQNLILWDGIKVYQSGHFFGLISAFNPHLAKNVFIAKNGTSAIYGDGVSSIIDIQLDESINDTFSGGIGFNFIDANAVAKIPLSKKVELQVSARRSITDVIETPTFNQYFDRVFQNTEITNTVSETNQTVIREEAFYFYDVGTKLLYDISKKDKVRFNFTSIFNSLDYLEETINTRDASSSGITQQNLATGITYSRDWNTSFSSDIQLYGSFYTLDATNADIINVQRLNQKNEVLDTGIKLNTNYKIRNGVNWINGYQLFEVGVTNLEDIDNPPFRSNIKEVLRSHALYSEVQITTKSKKTDIKTGLRANYFGKFDKVLLEPRVSFTQEFLKDFKVEILGELKSQTTSQIIDRQNDFIGVESRRWVISNDSTIPIIRSKQASIGLQYNKNKLLVSAEGYLKKVDGITARSQGFQNQFQFVNAIGDYEVRGIDFLINKRFTNLSAWLSYSFSENYYEFDTLNDGNPFPNNADIKHALTFAGAYTVGDNLKFALGVNWRSGNVTTLPDGDSPFAREIIYGPPNGERVNDYVRTDFSSTYTFDLKGKAKGKIGISLWNILNRENILNTYFIVNDDSTISRIDNKSLGITPNFSFRVSF
ncbi:TonB-dependent receptor plug domain-containing protein [uncultured Dokdonia sp.]|uniref:TonB-dependent receptor plug domain-containing protein n=1 Tax=uncultured Dokdonia sp. TaxID=575653 RepID=UPI0026386415|nr:TonB-dependent receptor plug domain-containing protein [uncultured Dokdonia sp.]